MVHWNIDCSGYLGHMTKIATMAIFGKKKKTFTNLLWSIKGPMTLWL